jgi:hypothetical protein
MVRQLRQVMVAEGPGYTIAAEGRSRVAAGVVQAVVQALVQAARTQCSAANEEASSAGALPFRWTGSGAQHLRLSHQNLLLPPECATH